VIKSLEGAIVGAFQRNDQAGGGVGGPVGAETVLAAGASTVTYVITPARPVWKALLTRTLGSVAIRR
jgi:hypothetical protein